MAKDNKITVMPKVKSDFDKFARALPESETITQVTTEQKVEYVNDQGGLTEATMTRTITPTPDATETVKGTATFNRGGTMPDITPKEGADPLHVECLTLFRRLIAGGYITPWALPVLYDVDKMIAKLKDTVEVKT